MIYRESLVMRKALLWYGAIAAGIMILNLAMRHGFVGADFDYGTAFGQAAAFAALFAWIFGVALGNGSRESARVLWVLPAERWKLALQVIAVDLAGITIAFALEYALTLLFFALAGLRTPVRMHGSISAASIVLGLVFAYAMYGWSSMLGMLGRRVPYFGILSAPALVLWLSLAQNGGATGALLRAPVFVNPVAVFNTVLALTAEKMAHAHVDAVSSSLRWLGTSWETPLLAAIALATCALAILSWQRAQTMT